MQTRPGSGGLVGAGAKPSNDGGQAQTFGDQQTRQWISAQDAHSRCACRLPKLSKGETPLGAWLRGLLARAHVNTVVVALAAKLARIAWAVIRSGEKFNMKAATVS
jgi:hypothetical protein